MQKWVSVSHRISDFGVSILATAMYERTNVERMRPQTMLLAMMAMKC